MLKELKAKVFALKFKQGGSQIDKSKKFPKVEGEKAVMRKPPLDRDGSETPCCVMLTKPMENILIRLAILLLYSSILCKGALRLQLSLLDLGIHASNTSLISIDEHVGVAF